MTPRIIRAAVTGQSIRCATVSHSSSSSRLGFSVSSARIPSSIRSVLARNAFLSSSTLSHKVPLSPLTIHPAACPRFPALPPSCSPLDSVLSGTEGTVWSVGWFRVGFLVPSVAERSISAQEPLARQADAPLFRSSSHAGLKESIPDQLRGVNQHCQAWSTSPVTPQQPHRAPACLRAETAGTH
jgi:hypothetical protein